MIDTHAHLNFKDFADNYADVIKKCWQHKLKAIINVGSNLQTSAKAIEISKQYNRCYAAVALHPIHVSDEEFDKNQFTNLMANNLEYVKAIGETGLDFFHKPADEDLQVKIFIKHLELAQRFNLPVILHSRDSRNASLNSYKKILEIITNYPNLKGVIHCFSSDWKIAQQFLKIGFYVGFTGPITFKNVGQDLLGVVGNMPLNRILIETDSPFLAPEPHRGQQNQPYYVEFIARKIAKLKNISFEEVSKITDKNAQTLFNL
ncbi:TatD family hydrolase [Patescibacteria group bacterium]|nr:TatD family hydrolase [Patescibacteria group bacterium]